MFVQCRFVTENDNVAAQSVTRKSAVFVFLVQTGAVGWLLPAGNGRDKRTGSKESGVEEQGVVENGRRYSKMV